MAARSSKRPAGPLARQQRKARAAGGMTLIEVAVATLIVGLLASALHTAGETILAGLREGDDSWQATELGLALLGEIASLPFDDPQLGEGVLGPEAGEWTPGGKRTLFNDVDDYAVWTAGMPLQEKDGTPIALSSYARAVAVDYVDPDDFGLVSAQATDYKRITVSVYLRGELRNSFTTVRVQGGRDVDFDG
ncbi:MAG: hypothetical protein KAY32_00190 [Candidatus Eisenbacteria sp.]|nr:hypothetical protein [Candidatus Eisenbacteria bacterium]